MAWRPSASLAVLAIVLALLSGVAVNIFTAASTHLGALRVAENVIERVDRVWEAALTNANATELSVALAGYTHVVQVPPLTAAASVTAAPSSSAASVPATTESPTAASLRLSLSGRINGAVASVFVWLARGLRLRALHRIAAARELLRDSRHADDKEMLPLIAMTCMGLSCKMHENCILDFEQCIQLCSDKFEYSYQIDMFIQAEF